MKVACEDGKWMEFSQYRVKHQSLVLVIVNVWDYGSGKHKEL
jgi:hypothetical protein